MSKKIVIITIFLLTTNFVNAVIGNSYDLIKVSVKTTSYDANWKSAARVTPEAQVSLTPAGQKSQTL